MAATVVLGRTRQRCVTAGPVGQTEVVGRVTVRRQVTRISADAPPTVAPDTLVAEEPLELRIAGRAIAVTMRTPGDDMDLLAGFLVGEGVIRRRDDLLEMRYCAGTDDAGRNTYNVLDATLADHVPPVDVSLQRALMTTSACGLCGKASIDAVEVATPYDLRADDLRVDATWIASLPERLRDAQRVFDRTGGLHAAALFDASTDDLLVMREDVGRHNAVDKVVGWALREDRLPPRGTVLLVSGRASFELAQKASVAGIPMLAAISAPSALAVDLAERVGLSLIGFLRPPTMVGYAGVHRVTNDAADRAHVIDPAMAR
jgi:FdhD protein